MLTDSALAYALSLHDALPIFRLGFRVPEGGGRDGFRTPLALRRFDAPRLVRHATEGETPAAVTLHHRGDGRSEEHTSELQSPCNLVCHLLHEKKKSDNEYYSR